MTNDKDSTCDDSQQQPPFQVVLIDLQKAVKGEIYCVKKSLAEELKYVAISYRWGELHEVNVDTRVGYVASITSFDLDDFYQLCATMTKEPDLKSMDYVWVDTICVNQSNYDERKATIYHMSEIYEHATWILAVPDLHAAHLWSMTNHRQAMESIQQHQSYLYHLINHNIQELYTMDASFLDSIDVPQDPGLRHLLTKNTKCFADYFARTSLGTHYIEDVGAIAQLFGNHQHSFTSDKHKEVYSPLKDDLPWILNEIKPLHQCNDGENCPFQNKQYAFDRQQINGGWHINITERRKLIHLAMYFLKDLFLDWSSRVWVISEFHIAKKKKNLKLWFYQLDGRDNVKRPSSKHKIRNMWGSDYDLDGSLDPFICETFSLSGSTSLPGSKPNSLTFFEVNMDEPPLRRFRDGRKLHLKSLIREIIPGPMSYCIPFYDQLIDQLNSQTFLEMMLHSKASKNEDRFYSIFPLFPYYKDLLQRQKNLVTNVNTILSVKLKLYQHMTNEHKLFLFYLSAQGKSTYILPTFATSLIDWGDAKHVYQLEGQCKDADIDIVLCQDTKIDNSGLYYLSVKPMTYRLGKGEVCTDITAGKTLARLLHLKRKTQGPETDDALRVDVVRIKMAVEICLIGNFLENIWILSPKTVYKEKDELKDLTDDFSGFHVY